MYTVDRPVRIRERHPVRNLLITLTVLGLAGAIGGVLVYRDAQRSQEIGSQQNNPIVTTVEEEIKATQTVDEPLYTFELPKDWKILSRSSPSDPYQYVEWQEGNEPKSRSLKVYVDALPLDTAVNRLMPVSIANNRLYPGSVSENCVTFTGQKTPDGKPASTEGKLLSKWQNVSFFCDMSNVHRNVIGSGTPEHGYAIPLTGDTKGKHNFFLVYTDHNARPTTVVMSEAIRTLKVK